MAGDRGFDSRANREYLESRDIFNAVSPRNPQLMAERLEDPKFKKLRAKPLNGHDLFPEENDTGNEAMRP